jgi:hypothetical protein
MSVTFLPNGTNGVHSAADESIDSLYSWWPAPPPAPQALPEAAFSLTLKGLLDGHEALLTVRGATAAEFTENLKTIRGLLDAPKAPVQPTEQGKDWCVKHGVQMTLNTKEGCSWWSHRLPEGWCKGR